MADSIGKLLQYLLTGDVMGEPAAIPYALRRHIIESGAEHVQTIN